MFKSALKTILSNSRGYLPLCGCPRHAPCCAQINHVHLWSSGYDVSLTR